MYLTTPIEYRADASGENAEVGYIDKTTGGFVKLLNAVPIAKAKDTVAVMRIAYQKGREDRAAEVASILRGIINL